MNKTKTKNKIKENSAPEKEPQKVGSLPSVPKDSHRYTSAQLLDAKRLYLKSCKINDIADRTGVAVSALHYHIPVWREEREMAKSEIIAALTENKKSLMASIAKNGLEILAKSMEELRNSDTILTPKEMVGLTNVIDSLDKISKLDDNKPTDISEKRTASTVFEVKKLLQDSDPFLQLDSVDEKSNISEVESA